MQTASTLTEPAIRPKVMRRPAHFAGGETLAAGADSAAETANIPTIPTLYTPPARYWQEDARFGLALVLLVVVINALLILCLPLAGKGARMPGATFASAEPNAPVASEAPAGLVTIYTQPGGLREGGELVTHTRLAPLLGTRPDEMPVPRATPLGNGEE